MAIDLRARPRLWCAFQPCRDRGFRGRTALPVQSGLALLGGTGRRSDRRCRGAAADCGDVPLGVTQPSGSDAQALVWEAVLARLLPDAGRSSRSQRTRGRSGKQRRSPSGELVALGALVGGPVSGASMNPARSIGPAVVSGDLSHLSDLPRRATDRGHRRGARLPLPPADRLTRIRLVPSGPRDGAERHMRYLTRWCDVHRVMRRSHPISKVTR